MDTTRVFVVGTVLVTVLALALGAPALDDLNQEEESDGVGEGSPAAQADEEPGDGPELDFEEGSHTWGYEPLTEAIIAGLLLGIVMSAALLYGFGPVRMLRVFAVIVGVFVVFLAIYVHLGGVDIPFVTDDPNVWGEIGLGDETGDGADETAGEGAEEASDDSISSVVVSAGTLLVLLAGSLLGVALVYAYSGERDEDETDVADQVDAGEGPVAATDLGNAAGRALEQSPETSAENSIYRAWAEMTGELDVDNPQVRTPAEFEQAAIDAGMSPADVEELTDLFRAVRYGDTPVTDDREEEARDLLERIEKTYSPGYSGGITNG